MLRYLKTTIYTILLLAPFFLGISNAHASFIIQRPLYIGLTNNLVGYWTFDGQDMDATVAYDKSNSGFNGTLTNGPVKTIGKIGQALSFDGNNEYVAIGDPVLVTGALTISAWIQLNSDYTSIQTIVGNDGTTGLNASYVLEFGRTDKKITFLQNGATLDFTAAGSISNNYWHHVVLTRTGSTGAWTIILYVDGVLDKQGSTAVNPITSVSNASIGRPGLFDASYFTGLIDDVRIYNRVLTPKEANLLYRIGAATKFNTTNKDTLTKDLVGHWTFDGADTDATVAYDKSNHNNNGTLTNGPAKTIGRFGQALDFDGTNDFVKISAAVATAEPLTLCAWFNSSSDTARQNLVSIGGSGATAGDYVWSLYLGGEQAGDPVIALSANDSPSVYSEAQTTVGYTINSWHHACAVFTSTTQRDIYLDGGNRVTDTGNITVVNSQNQTRIGSDGSSANPSNTFNGQIDDVRIYNRALTEAEVLRLYRMGATTKINTTNANTLQKDLIGYWTFDGADMAGSTAYDRTNNNNKVSGKGDIPATAIGKFGQALRFDGANTWMETADDADALDITGPTSISAWIYPYSLGESSVGTIVDNQQASAGYFLTLDTTNRISYSIGGSTVSSNNNAITLNTWQHIVAVFDGASVMFYVNNAQVGSGQISAPAGNAVTFSIGARNDGAQTFDGVIDDVRVYGRALTGAEIRRLYNMGR